jgi:hypothetical protein
MLLGMLVCALAAATVKVVALDEYGIPGPYEYGMLYPYEYGMPDAYVL